MYWLPVSEGRPPAISATIVGSSTPGPRKAGAEQQGIVCQIEPSKTIISPVSVLIITEPFCGLVMPDVPLTPDPP